MPSINSAAYSFVVVLLEVLCARPAIDNSLPRQQVNLADWGMSCLTKGELHKIADPLLLVRLTGIHREDMGKLLRSV